MNFTCILYCGDNHIASCSFLNTISVILFYDCIAKKQHAIMCRSAQCYLVWLSGKVAPIAHCCILTWISDTHLLVHCHVYTYQLFPINIQNKQCNTNHNVLGKKVSSWWIVKETLIFQALFTFTNKSKQYWRCYLRIIVQDLYPCTSLYRITGR